LGVQPLAAGAAVVGVHPQPGRLRRVEGRVPTMRGPVDVALRQQPGVACELECALPANVHGELSLPWSGGTVRLWLDGAPVAAPCVDGRLVFGRVGPGRHHALARAG
jgi:alpha-L-rhamnosidase